MKRIITSFSAILFVVSSFAQVLNPTWAKDIAPIMYKNCTNCHHVGGAGHGSLMTYTDANNLAGLIQYHTENKSMPPWPPDRDYNNYADERHLTDKQINLIKTWVNNGALAGDTTLAPAPPIYSNSDLITNADLTGKIPTFTVFSNSDLYQCFVIPSGLTQDEFLTAIELIPGNSSIVHHVLMFQDTTGAARQKDNADPNPGYTNFGGIGVASPILIGAWVPGSRPFIYPQGLGVKIYKNADIVLQIHYPSNSLNQVDSTKFNMKLSASSLRQVIIQPILNHRTSGPGSLINGPLSIAPNTIQTFVSKFKNNYTDLSLLAIAPHMHLIGKSIKVFSVNAAKDTTPLINIKDWDFKWQGQYSFQKLTKLPKGDTAFAEAIYDNTAANQNNPNKSNPLQVTLGEATTNEMMLVYVSFLVYVNGDENFVVDSTDYDKMDSITDANIDAQTPSGIEFAGVVSSLQFYEPYPNPANNSVKVSFFLPASSEVSLKVYDMLGQKVAEISPKFYKDGFGDMMLNTSNISSGNYVLELSSSYGSRSKNISISK